MDNSVLILNGQVVRTDGLIEADGKLKLMTKLWENPNPGARMDAQNITLSSDDYDFLLVISNGYDSGYNTSVIAEKGKAVFDLDKVFSEQYGTVAIRRFTRVSDTVYSMSDSTYAKGNTSNIVTDNRALVPLAIYGFKKEYNIDVLARNATAKEIYSTDETVVGTWVDGKPIYRKVLVDAFTIPASQTNFATGSAIVSNVDTLVKSTLIAKRTNKWQCNSSYYYYETGGNADACSLWVDPDAHAIKPYAKNAIAAATTYTAIVEYTKTTD